MTTQYFSLFDAGAESDIKEKVFYPIFPPQQEC
jgi:hypothetical protein